MNRKSPSTLGHVGSSELRKLYQVIAIEKSKGELGTCVDIGQRQKI